jgi:hypothetical protein
MKTQETNAAPTVGQQRLVLRSGIRPAIKYLRDYLNTYEDQAGVDEYTVEIWIEDILYGLGMSLDPKSHKWFSGHAEFKEKLREYLSQNSEVNSLPTATPWRLPK